MKPLNNNRNFTTVLILFFLLLSFACTAFQSSVSAMEANIDSPEINQVLMAFGDDDSEDEDEESCSIEDDDNDVPPPPGMEDDDLCGETEDGATE